MQPVLAIVLLGALLNCLWPAGAHADPGAQTVYKSVGPDGKIRYSDRPPADGKLEKTLTFANLPASTLPPSYLERLKKVEAAAATAPPSGVVLYSAAWCGYCKKAKAYLAARSVAYQDIDVDSPAGMAAFAGVGGGGIPVLVSQGQAVRGFSTQAYDALFAGAR